MTNPWLWTVIAIGVIVGHVRWAFVEGSGQPVLRSGTIVIVVGLWVIARPMVRQGYHRWLERLDIIDGGEYPAPPAQVEAERQDRIDAVCVQIVGPVMVLAGTLLSGYGDLTFDALRRVASMLSR